MSYYSTLVSFDTYKEEVKCLHPFETEDEVKRYITTNSFDKNGYIKVLNPEYSHPSVRDLMIEKYNKRITREQFIELMKDKTAIDYINFINNYNLLQIKTSYFGTIGKNVIPLIN